MGAYPGAERQINQANRGRRRLSTLRQYYKLEVSSALKKSELKKLVIEYLVEEEVVSEDDSELPPTASPSSSLELKRLELQDKETERESQLKLKELEIREKEQSVQLRLRELDSPPVVAPPKSASTSQFDISKHISLCLLSRRRRLTSTSCTMRRLPPA